MFPLGFPGLLDSKLGLEAFWLQLGKCGTGEQKILVRGFQLDATV